MPLAGFPFRRLAVAALALGFALQAPLAASAGAVEQKLEAALTEAMTANRAAGQRMLPSGAAIKQFIKAGFVRRKPEARQDYSDYRRLRKAFTFMGETVVSLEEQYLVEFIGCCVDEGIGALLALEGSGDAVEAFGKANGCLVTGEAYYVDTSLTAVGLKRDGRRYLYIYCGLRGLAG